MYDFRGTVPSVKLVIDAINCIWSDKAPSRSLLRKLTQDVRVILDSLRPGDQVLAVENDGGDAADALLDPEVLDVADFRCETLIGQNRQCLGPVKTGFSCHVGQNGVIGEVAAIGEMGGEQSQLQVVLAAQGIGPVQQLMGVECVVHRMSSV